ncbi:SemiSWEET transporter [Undibacterium sp. RTI2.2]|nr:MULTISPECIES: SemiSWEET transporter [unclassified Undibacterium]MDY7539053.1 SemiSWEET transporter [Undibacterium sp. 5I1]MEB0115869.1 SemiSWEET transporter [Undibacterium sp. RTI2.2]MEB0229813.1 SemiSWEET transporter [Undibacterium sp. 10I3]MEB0258282.1 SemiSWEET transporter [Undibacterium sp. 5I1]
MPQLTDLIGYIAASMTTTAFIPQAWMTWRRKRADGVSLGMYIILVGGIAMWLAYGLMLNALPIIIANFITLVLAIFILVMKLLYK